MSKVVQESSNRIAMIVHNYFPLDERVRRQAYALIDAGYNVDVICLQRINESKEELLDSIRIFRLPICRHRERGKSVYILEYFGFFLMALLKLTALNNKASYAVVQVHTPPDPLVFASLIGRLSGARVVIDIHDLSPELYMSRYKIKEGSILQMALIEAEKSATKYANHVLTANELFKQRLISRGIDADKITVVGNSPDTNVFKEHAKTMHKHKSKHFTIINHGTLVERYGLDIAIKAVALLRSSIPNIRFLIYGEGNHLPQLQELTAQLKLEDTVHFGGYVDKKQITRLICSSDVGIVPNKPDMHIDIAFPSKLFEYVVMGLPVIASRTPILKSVFDEDEIIYFDNNDEYELAEKILWAYEHPDETCAYAERAYRAYLPLRWDVTKVTYLSAIAEAFSSQASIPAPGPLKLS